MLDNVRNHGEYYYHIAVNE